MNSSYLWINELRVHYYHWGLENGGRPVVLLHGLASNARIWERVAPLLVAHELSVLAPDSRGHGLTDKPGGDYGFETFRRDLLLFLDSCNLENPILVGHSWGAALALYYATRTAFGPRAPAGLVLVDGGMTQLDAAPGATWEAVEQRLTPPRLAGMPLSDFIERVQAGNSWEPSDQDLSIILSNFEIQEGEEGETIWPRLTFDHHMEIVRAMWELKTYDLFRQVRCPVLMLPSRPAGPLGEEAKAHLAQKEQGIARAQAALAHLEVNWLENTIHDSPLQRPQEVAERIAAFTARVEKGAFG